MHREHSLDSNAFLLRKKVKYTICTIHPVETSFHVSNKVFACGLPSAKRTGKKQNHENTKHPCRHIAKEYITNTFYNDSIVFLQKRPATGKSLL